MLKLLVTATALFVFIAFPARAIQQDGISIQKETVSGHSVSLNGLGLAYSYEYAFATKGTVIFSAGSSYSYGRTLRLEMKSFNEFYIGTKDYHLVTGDLSVEPRFYYNLQKRQRKGKRTFENSGGYLSASFGYSFPIAITGGVKSAHIYTIVPYWGFRRVWRHFMFDLAGGVGYLGASNGTSAVYPNLRIGLGYRF